MNDRDFLIWIHERLTNVHKESPLVDYMHKLRAIIRNTPKDKATENISSCNNIRELLKELSNEQ